MCPGWTGDLWWAWVDLNHRPRPYQGPLRCYMHGILFVRRRSTVARCDIKTFREGHHIQFAFSKISIHSSSVSSCHFSFERYGRNSLSYLSRRIWELSFFVLKM
jgi:hypothetical protein